MFYRATMIATLFGALLVVGCSDSDPEPADGNAGEPAADTAPPSEDDGAGTDPTTTADPDQPPDEADSTDDTQSADTQTCTPADDTDEGTTDTATPTDDGTSTTGDGEGDEEGTAEAECAPPGFMSFLSVADNNGQQSVDMSAQFFQLNQILTLEQINTNIAPVLDQCIVAPLDTRVELIRPVDISALEVRALGAGEVIPVASPAGSYAELTLLEDEPQPLYVNSDEAAPLLPPSPSTLSYTIPGGEFPAALDPIAIPTVAALQWGGPDLDQPIAASATFSWAPDDSPDSSMFISLIGEQLAVACAVEDDGSFQIPGAAQAELGAGFQSIFGIAFRATYSLVQRGDTVDVTLRIVD